MQFDIITIFPEVFSEYFRTSIIGRAQKKGKIKIKIHNLRDFTSDKHRSVDDTPYGGGAGMVMLAEPIIKAVSKIRIKSRDKKVKVVLFSAKGKRFTQKYAVSFSKVYDQMILICGRYEGVDERVKTILKSDEISMGPYILTDGEIPSMLLVSAVTRLIPGVISKGSLDEESFSDKDDRLVEYPHYTRPEVLSYKSSKYEVPKVLLSGNHAEIYKWRQEKTQLRKK